MKIRVNGEVMDVAGNLSVADLVRRMNLPSEGVAVAVNNNVIRRSDHASTRLCENDVVEIIHAVGGGSSALVDVVRPR